MVHCKQCGSTDVARRAVFCSRSCAATFNNKRLGRRFTPEQIKKSLLNRRPPDRKTAVEAGKKSQRGRNPKPKNIFNLSSRTRLKVLQRLGISCFVCGWDKAVCDVHHILNKKDGGSNEHSNLSYLCPNCHRLAHSGLLERMPTFEEVIGERWLILYYG